MTAKVLDKNRIIMPQNNGNYTNLVEAGYILEMEGLFSALFCTFHLLYDCRFFSSSKIVNFTLLTSYDDAFFWPKMSAIITKNVRKHCFYAWIFLRVWGRHKNLKEYLLRRREMTIFF
jgi:hypothetical protein